MLSLLLLIPLAVLIVSDIACRNVSLWWLLAFGSLTIAAGIARGGCESMLLNAGGNIMAMAFVGGGMGVLNGVIQERDYQKRLKTEQGIADDLPQSICIGIQTGRCTINIDPYSKMVPTQPTYYVPKL